jgi:hypothetical protein
MLGFDSPSGNSFSVYRIGPPIAALAPIASAAVIIIIPTQPMSLVPERMASPSLESIELRLKNPFPSAAAPQP